jgi:hypothetical protein
MFAPALLATAATPAFAARGAVKVECQGNCGNVTLGEICDRYSVNSLPVQVSCDDAAKSGGQAFCGPGTATCFSNSYGRTKLLSSFCIDGSGTDALVTCQR